MSDSLFSPSWYRVAALKPRIRAHVDIHRHSFRGQVWFVLHDPAAERAHRFTPAAHHVIGLMDGRRSVQQIWEAASAHLADAAPTQEDVIRLLAQLHAADALLSDVPADSEEVFRRYQKQERLKWKRRLWSPLSLRFPLIDPDRFLARTQRWVAPLFGGFGLALWLLVVGSGAVLSASHWTDLTENVADRVLAPTNLLLLWLVYPCVKALHELGHAYATKHWGGEVHEIGIMLLVFAPVPYVDASAATGFKDKRQRMVVGAAGIAVELFLGSLALFTWLTVEPGLVSNVAFNVMLISGVSTLLFNGNPLLRFDGYYVLSDWLEIPNLGARSNQYLGYLFQRHLLGVKDARSPAHGRGERIWMVVYGITSFIYRSFITVIIVTFIASRFFVIGVLLAIWAVATQMLVPIGKGVRYLTNSPNLRRNRARAWLTGGGLALAALLLLFVAPAPLWTRAEGVISVPDEAQVRTGTEGFAVEVMVDADTAVKKGQPLARLEDPVLATRVAVLESEQRALLTQYESLVFADPVQAAVVAEELATTEANLARMRDRVRELVLRSPVDGRWVLPRAADLPGRFVPKGQLVGYVVRPNEFTARVLVQQDDIVRVRERTREVEVVLPGWESRPIAAKILREVPGGSSELPTAALGTSGGGRLAVDPRDPKGVTSLNRLFQLELSLPYESYSPYLGARVQVRFNHGWQPAGVQIYLAVRRLLLRQFDV